MDDTKIQLIAGYTASIVVSRITIVVVIGALWGWKIALGALFAIWVASKVANKCLYTYLRVLADKAASDRLRMP